jgi:hypothetical protein
MKKLLVWRIVVTVLIFCGLFAFSSIYERSRGPLEGSAAVGQLEDSDATYIVSRSAAQGDVQKFVNLFGVVLVLVVWGTFVPGLIACLKKEEKEV